MNIFDPLVETAVITTLWATMLTGMILMVFRLRYKRWASRRHPALGRPVGAGPAGVMSRIDKARQRREPPLGTLFAAVLCGCFGVYWFTFARQPIERELRINASEGSGLLGSIYNAMNVWRARWGGYNAADADGRTPTIGPVDAALIGFDEDDYGTPMYRFEFTVIEPTAFTCVATVCDPFVGYCPSPLSIDETGDITNHELDEFRRQCMIVNWIWVSLSLLAVAGIIWSVLHRRAANKRLGGVPAAANP